MNTLRVERQPMREAVDHPTSCAVACSSLPSEAFVLGALNGCREGRPLSKFRVTIQWVADATGQLVSAGEHVRKRLCLLWDQKRPAWVGAVYEPIERSSRPLGRSLWPMRPTLMSRYGSFCPTSQRAG